MEVDGFRFEEDLGFSPWGGSAGARCERDPDCWGVLRETLEFDWWVRVDDLQGKVGWVPEQEGFDKLITQGRDPEFFAECRRRRERGTTSRWREPNGSSPSAPRLFRRW